MSNFDWSKHISYYNRTKIVKLIREEGASAKRQGKHRETNPYDGMDQYQWWMGYDYELDPARDEETPCPKRDDSIHCDCWYDGKSCCACGEK